MSIFFLLLPKLFTCIPIDNSVVGDLKLECDSQTIQIQVGTNNPFFGNLYVKDFSSDDVCLSRGTGRLTALLVFDIGLCGAFRRRTLNPRGTVIETTVVVSFHPFFITKVDRAYHLTCIYKEFDALVSQSIEADEITTRFVPINITMPKCSYEILDGGPNGAPVKFGLIGQQVYHQWKCQTENDNTFCMFVHTCITEDGQGDKAFLIDSNGCSIDRYLLSNLEYPGDLTAGQEAHVYKFADRDSLYFQCQISITVKEPNEECFRPICDGEIQVAGGGKTNPYRGKHVKSVQNDFDETNDIIDTLIEKSKTAAEVETEYKRSKRYISNAEIIDVTTNIIVLDIRPKKTLKCLPFSDLFQSYVIIYIMSLSITVAIVVVSQFYF